MITRVCNGCGVEKLLSEFHKKLEGHQSKCKTCRNHYTAVYREEFPDECKQAVEKWKVESPIRFMESHKKSNLKRSYGITLDQYREMEIKQGGCCLICSCAMVSPQVDHCHKTGKIRGLLCATCNGGLGMFKDCVPLLEKAIQYLKES